jgi:recombinational DNA repair ATPase RecF
MILKCFDYSEFSGQPNAWSVKKFLLNDKVNLLVGKNASGKSRTLDRINWLGNMLTGLSPRSMDMVDAASFSVEYNDISDDYFYTLKTQNLQIISEELSISNGNKTNTVLKRKWRGRYPVFWNERKC